jgi:hypothetical protein
MVTIKLTWKRWMNLTAVRRSRGLGSKWSTVGRYSCSILYLPNPPRHIRSHQSEEAGGLPGRSKTPHFLLLVEFLRPAVLVAEVDDTRHAQLVQLLHVTQHGQRRRTDDQRLCRVRSREGVKRVSGDGPREGLQGTGSHGRDCSRGRVLTPPGEV